MVTQDSVIRTKLATDETLKRMAECLVKGKKKQRDYAADQVALLGLGLKDFTEKTAVARAANDLELRSILFGVDF